MARLANWSDRQLLAAFTAMAIAVRLYLALTSFCISGDAVAYLGMARHYDQGYALRALESEFSPLYPWLISMVHRVVPDWELAGQLISVLFGAGTVPLSYLLAKEIGLGRRIALGAAALTAIHPELAEFSGTVRTEAGYIFLMVASVYLLISGIRRRHFPSIICAGALDGLGYLYRTEAVGVAIVGVTFLFAASVLWRKWGTRFSALAAIYFAIGFLVPAAPYFAYLRVSTGYWMVGRELPATLAFEMAHMTKDARVLRAIAFSTSVFELVRDNPGLYATKVARDTAMSIPYFGQALGPLLMFLLGIGIWTRRTEIASHWSEMLLVSLIIFYAAGFTMSISGRRPMAHIIVFALGWVAVGFFEVADRLEQLAARRGVKIGWVLCAAIVTVLLMAQTLRPIGYDLRGIRYAGLEIKRQGRLDAIIVASDGRVAYYAGRPSIELPPVGGDKLCEWMAKERKAGYLLVTQREEQRLGEPRALSCLKFMRRYPRSRNRYFDLFEIGNWKQQALATSDQ